MKMASTFKVPLPPGPLTVFHAECPGWPGEGVTCVDPATGEMYFANPVAAFALAHEIGHVFDHRVLSDRDRARFGHLLGALDVPWLNGTGLDCGPRDCPSELFADAYALCATKGDRFVRRTKRGAIVGGGESAYGHDPSPRRHRTICTSIRFAALG